MGIFTKTLTTIDIRKSAVTMIFPNASDDERRNLAVLMCHRRSTQERAYNINKRREDGAAAVVKLTQSRITLQRYTFEFVNTLSNVFTDVIICN